MVIILLLLILISLMKNIDFIIGLLRFYIHLVVLKKDSME